MRVTRTLAALVVATLGGASLAVGASALDIPGAEPGDVVYDRLATYPVYLNLPEDVDPSEETVAEISAVSPDGTTVAYTDAAQGAVGFVDITDPANPVGVGTLPVSELGDGEPTSIAIVGEKLLVVVDTSQSYTDPSGALFVVDLDSHEVLREIDLGGQPDSIDISKNGKFAAIAIENQRDEDLGDGGLPQLPSGFVQIVRIQGDVNSWKATPVHLTAGDGSPLPIIEQAGIYEPTDLEPEYVAFKDAPLGNERGLLAVSLQENNGIVLINAVNGKIVGAFSAGSVTVGGVDVVEEDTIDQSGTITDVPREPDSLGWIGDHVVTANEGDLFGGSRGWTIFDTTGGVVWDAGNTFAEEIVRVGLHNEGRSENKGAEPEGLAVTEIDGVPVVLVGSERSNAVLAYDVSDVREPVLLQVLPTTNGPEGILPVPSRDLLVISSEEDDADARVRASVSLYGTGAWLGTGWSPAFPQLVSADVANPAADDGTSPIGWGALGALAADPEVATRLYTATDAAFSPSRILAIDTSATPAVIDGEITVTESGNPIGLDIEGLAVRPSGGFWLGVEGNGRTDGTVNEIVRVDDAGVVQERIALGTELEATIGSNGVEGVAVTEIDGVEHVTVAIQRISNAVRDYTFIGQYNTATEEWTWSTYALEAASPDSETVSSDWIGLSEIVAIDDESFAVIERDKLNGPDAALKAVFVFDLQAGSGADTLADAAAGNAVDKSLALDVLPLLKATNGWVQEKLEGLAIAADGTVYAITDNDGVDDATGETVFVTLGSAEDLFADWLE